jgi:hypothetical protein
MTTAHQLPQPHEPEDGTLEPEAETVEELREATPDYDAEETNAKEGPEDYEPAHAAPVTEDDVPEAPVDTPVETMTATESDEKGFIPSKENPDEGKVQQKENDKA